MACPTESASYNLMNSLTSQQLLWIAVAIAVIAFITWLLTRLVLKARAAEQIGRLEEKLSAELKNLEEIQQRLSNSSSKLDTLQEKESQAMRKIGELEVELREEREVATEKQSLLEKAEQRLSETFKSLSVDALRKTQDEFLKLANETLKAREEKADLSLKQRHEAVQLLVKPVAETLEKVQGRLGEIEKQREGAYAALKEQVSAMSEGQKNLQIETNKLVSALRQPTGRGQWGEMQLRRVVEMAGMQEHSDFDTQSHVKNDDGKALRPDLVVHLPGGKQIVVDSKTPMQGYLDALETDDENVRSDALARHAKQVHTHIQQLGSKNYQDQFDSSPEFVVLFLPSESFFSAALAQDSSLIEKGVNQGVILATPTTLIALLKAVAYGWRQEALAENALKISQLGRELYERVAKFAEHFGKVGKNLETAVNFYNSAVGSFENRVLSSTRKFEELGAAPEGMDIPEIPTIEKQTRVLTAQQDQGAFIE